MREDMTARLMADVVAQPSAEDLSKAKKKVSMRNQNQNRKKKKKKKKRKVNELRFSSHFEWIFES